MFLPLMPPVYIVLWNPAGPTEALRVATPRIQEFGHDANVGIIVHGTTHQLRTEGATVCAALTNAGFASTPFEIAGNADPVATAIQDRADTLTLARSLRHLFTIMDAEARWKQAGPSYDASAAQSMCATARQLGIPLVLSTYPDPTSHNDPTEHYCWKDGWRYADAYAAQMYQTGSSLASCQAGLLSHIRSWGLARNQQLVSAAPVIGELPAGGSPAACLVYAASHFERAIFWTAGCSRADDPTSLDDEGMTAIRTLVRLAAHGFIGRGALDQFQAHTNLVPDGVLGPKTLAALGL